MESRSIDIVSLGSVYFDINCLNFDFGTGLLPETETVGQGYQSSVGGSAVICPLVAASLGLRPAFIGKVGNDSFGATIAKTLESNGFHNALIVSSTHQTNLGINFVNPVGKTLMTVVGNANQHLEASEILTKLEELLPNTRLLYLGGFFKLTALIPYYETILAMAKKHGVR
jgi:sugar/nucleoside kinase (ribokinase family)